jgi:hypothetical protein
MKQKCDMLLVYHLKPSPPLYRNFSKIIELINRRNFKDHQIAAGKQKNFAKACYSRKSAGRRTTLVRTTQTEPLSTLFLTTPNHTSQANPLHVWHRHMKRHRRKRLLKRESLEIEPSMSICQSFLISL